MTPDSDKTYSWISGLKGIPDEVLQAHLKHYQASLRVVELLHQRLAEENAGAPQWADLQRRARFEADGLRLHQLYFDNLFPGGGRPSRDLHAAIESGWGSFRAWREEFKSLGSVSGMGWVILVQNPVSRNLSNHRVLLHGEGRWADDSPLLVMDVWDHAYAGMGRRPYLEAFLENVDWGQVECRMARVSAEGPRVGGPSGPPAQPPPPSSRTRVLSRSSLGRAGIGASVRRHR